MKIAKVVDGKLIIQTLQPCIPSPVASVVQLSKSSKPGSVVQATLTTSKAGSSVLVASTSSMFNARPSASASTPATDIFSADEDSDNDDIDNDAGDEVGGEENQKGVPMVHEAVLLLLSVLKEIWDQFKNANKKTKVRILFK
jgi:hypothetical protein